MGAYIESLRELCKGKASVIRRFHCVRDRRRVDIPLRRLFLSLKREDRVRSVRGFTSMFCATGHANNSVGQMVRGISHVLKSGVSIGGRVRTALTTGGSRRVVVDLVPIKVVLCLRVASPNFLDILCKGPFKVTTVDVYLIVCTTTC